MQLAAPNAASPNSFSRARNLVQTAAIRLIHQPIKFYINMTFHLALLAFHGVLLAYEVDHKWGKQHQTDSANELYVVVTTVIQWVSKAYQPILAWLTQGLALQHILKTAPSLSSLHDQSGAWLGLVPALLSLAHQIRRRTAVIGIALIALYYCLILLIGYTTTKYFDLGTRYNNTLLGQTTYLLTTLGPDDIADAFPVVDILPSVGYEIETYGLRGNYVFDLGSQGGPSDVLTSTSATQFNVSCYNIPELVQSTNPADINTTNPTYSFHVDDDIEDVEILPTPGAVNLADSRRRDNQSTSTLFITFAGAPVIDKLGNIASTTPINPPFIEDCPRDYTCDITSTTDYVPRIQMLACDVRANNSTIKVDTSLRPVRASYHDGVHVWSNWTSSQSPVPSYLAPIGIFSGLSPRSTKLDIRTVRFAGTNITATRRLSLLEDAVWKSLTSSDGGIMLDPHLTWDLAEVEYALGRVIAIVYWRASLRAIAKQLTFSYNDTDGEDVVILDIEFRRDWAWTGLAISILASLVAFILTLQPYTPPRVAGQDEDDGGLGFIESPGILQIVWLIGNEKHPEWMDLPRQLHNNLAGRPPKGSALKGAGMKIALNSPPVPASETASLMEEGKYDAIEEELRPQYSSLRYLSSA